MIVVSLAVHRLIALYETRPSRGGTPPEVTTFFSVAEPASTSARDGDCALDAGLDSLDEAMLERVAHRGHAPLCYRYLGAIAHLGGLQDDSYE